VNRVPKVRIDYNAETPDGRFFARASRLPAIALGQIVETHDEDGNRLVMAVEEINESTGIVYLRPDWSTWVDGDSDSLEVVPLRFPVPTKGVIGTNLGWPSTPVTVVVPASSETYIVGTQFSKPRSVTFHGNHVVSGSILRSNAANQT
jgi:hypothetical protein